MRAKHRTTGTAGTRGGCRGHGEAGLRLLWCFLPGAVGPPVALPSVLGGPVWRVCGRLSCWWVRTWPPTCLSPGFRLRKALALSRSGSWGPAHGCASPSPGIRVPCPIGTDCIVGVRPGPRLGTVSRGIRGSQHRHSHPRRSLPLGHCPVRTGPPGWSPGFPPCSVQVFSSSYSALSELSHNAGAPAL